MMKSPQRYTLAVLTFTVYAFTCLHLLLSFDTEAWEQKVASDLFLLVGLLNNHNNTEVNDAAVEGIALLVYHSQNWNDTIETALFELFELYQIEPPLIQVTIGKAIAFMYSLYDFSEQFSTWKKDPNSSLMFEIYTADNGQLMYELEHSRTCSKKLGSPKVEHELKKVKKSISLCLNPFDQCDFSLDNYEPHDRQLLEKLYDLKIGNSKSAIHTSWLQDLLYEPLVWLFQSFLGICEQRNDFVSNAFYSSCSLAVHTAKQDKRKGYTRSRHMRDPAFQLRAREEQTADSWVAGLSKRSTDEVTLLYRSDYANLLRKAKEKLKRQTRNESKDMRHERMNKVVLLYMS